MATSGGGISAHSEFPEHNYPLTTVHYNEVIFWRKTYHPPLLVMSSIKLHCCSETISQKNRLKSTMCVDSMAEIGAVLEKTSLKWKIHSARF